MSDEDIITPAGGAAIAAALDGLIRQGDAAGAARHAPRTLQALPERERVPVLLALAQAHQRLDQTQEALRVVGQARELALLHNMNDEALEASLRTAAILQSTDNHALAMTVLEESEPLAANSPDPWVRGRVLRRLGISASMLGRHEVAIRYLRDSLEIARAAAPPGRWLAVMGSLLNARSRRSSELPTSDPRRLYELTQLVGEWRELAAEQRSLGLLREEIEALSSCAICAWRSGNTQEALRELQALLPRYAEQRMTTAEMVLRNNIGRILLELGRPKEAAGAFQRTIERNGGGSPRALLEAWLGLVEAEEANDDPRAALAALKKARELDQRMTRATLSRWLDERELRRELARLNERGWRLAQEDPLTGLHNRRGMITWLDENLPHSSPGMPLSALLIDTDLFKAINDQLGHAVGDTVLKRIADIMRGQCRSRDVPARLGGDEFLLVLPGTRLTGATDVARRLCGAIASYPWSSLAPGLQVTVSIGVASSEQYAAHVPSAEELIALADSALYAAKHSGRNRAVPAPAPLV